MLQSDVVILSVRSTVLFFEAPRSVQNSVVFVFQNLEHCAILF